MLYSRLVLKNEIGETFVKTIDDKNNIVIVPVTIGKQQGEIVEIISDLPEGTKVVDQGKTSVSEGQTVKVISS